MSLTYGSNPWAGPQAPSFNLFKPEQTMLAPARTRNMIQRWTEHAQTEGGAARGNADGLASTPADIDAA
ncbi:hypothetical protein [Burkholderia sp. AU16741]|uniref:hypothetical protein n=1 Tax=Burkholderia sp. AU16741 TaxID=2015347 RepID=UPI0015C69504|nr:hypothetical protein [Burkholderia sp. AU16741]